MELNMRQNRSRPLRLLAVVGVATLVLAACGGGEDATGENNNDGSDPTAAAAGGGDGDCVLTIGALGPMTGPAASWGISERQAAEMAAWEVNQEGGLEIGDQQCTVEVLAYDDEYTSEGAAAGINEFAAEGIKFVVGPMGSPEVTGGKPAAQRHDMLLMADSFARDAIGPEWPLVFHQGPGPGVWAGPIIEAASEVFGPWENAALVAPNDQGGQDIAEVNAEAFEELGVSTQIEYYERGTQDFAPIVTRMLADNPDVVDVASSPPGDAGVIVRQLREAGYEGSIGRLGGPGTPEIADVAGGFDVLGDYWDYVPFDEEAPAVQEFAEQVQEALGEEPEPNAFLWTPSARVLLDGISAAGTMEDTEAVAEAIRQHDLDDPTLGQGAWTGQEEFGINQEMTFPFYVGIYQDGEFQELVELTAD